MTLVELTALVAIFAVLATMGINSHNFRKESLYLKNKYKTKGYDKGYLEGYDQGFLDGIEFIESVIPSAPKKKKTLWNRETK